MIAVEVKKEECDADTELISAGYRSQLLNGALRHCKLTELLLYISVVRKLC